MSLSKQTMGIRSILLLLVVVLSAVATTLAGWCPDKYRKYSLQHSYCLRTCCSCPHYKRGITPQLKEQILREHNKYRSKVAGGESYGVDHLPRASNMMEMVWDDELANIAQKWVDSCNRQSDCDLCRMVDRFAVGQSIVEFQGSIMTAKDYELEFFSNFNAIQNLKKGHITRYSDSDGKGRIAQLLWAKTWRIGCGFLYFYGSNEQKYSVLVCNYGPRGKVEGEEVYKAGSVCSACPANSCCGRNDCKKHGIESKYHGLCKVIDENLPPEGNVPHAKSGKEVFYCGFNGESDCGFTVDGINRWVHNVTTGGTWISTYIERGFYTILKFGSPMKSKSGKLCLSIVTRSGPLVADQPYAYKLTGRLEEESKYQTNTAFPQADDKFKHVFHTDYFQPMEFPKNREVKLTLEFSVPVTSSSQNFEISKIVAEEKDCPKQTATEGSSFSKWR